MKKTYKQRMQAKKAHIDARIAQAMTDKGICILLTGNGKGKTSSALGMVLRALGYDMSVVLVQFIKGTLQTGENLFLNKHPNVTIYTMNSGFTWETQDKEQDKQAAEKVWQKAKQALANQHTDMVVLDELTYMLNYGYLNTDEVIRTLINRPPKQHLIITGRAANDDLKQCADTISEIGNVKHAFDHGIKAQQGIDL